MATCSRRMALGVGRLLQQTAGRAALQRALPLYVAIAIVASIVFGDNGLSPATVSQLSGRFWPIRLALHMLEIDQVQKRLGARRVLDGVSATCGAGQVLVVLGENGSGKSTLLRIVAGIVEPDAGSVTLRGATLARGNPAARRQLGYAPDATQALPELLVEELLALVRALKALPSHISSELEQRWWERLGLERLLGQRVSTLSFGQRKRALTAAALAGDPWLLVLDEPSNGLDAAGAGLMLELIAERRARGQATLLASNDAPFVASLAGSTYQLAEGRLLSIA